MLIPRETSPYALMQEELRDEPWKLLVACICLNQCSARVARPVWERIFKRWVRAGSLLDDADVSMTSVLQELTDLVRPIGFQNRRAERIVRMTMGLHDQMMSNRFDRFSVDVRKLYGCGKYAADSYNMFIKGTLVEDVEDKELKNYVEWVKHEIRTGSG